MMYFKTVFVSNWSALVVRSIHLGIAVLGAFFLSLTVAPASQSFAEEMQMVSLGHQIETEPSPDAVQFEATIRLIKGVRSQSLTPPQFDNIASSLHPALLHVAIYYLMAVERREGRSSINQSMITQYMIRSSIIPLLNEALCGAVVESNPRIVAFDKIFATSPEGAMALASANPSQLLLMPFLPAI